MSDRLRKKIVYSLLPLAIIWAIYSYPTGRQPEKSQRPAAQVTASPIRSPVAQAGRLINIEEHTGRPWGKDPFRTYLYKQRRRQPDSRKPNWVLRGIVYSEDDPLAFINRQPVRVGEIVNQARVVAIGRKSVTLEHNGRRIELAVSKG